MYFWVEFDVESYEISVGVDCGVLVGSWVQCYGCVVYFDENDGVIVFRYVFLDDNVSIIIVEMSNFVDISIVVNVIIFIDMGDFIVVDVFVIVIIFVDMGIFVFVSVFIVVIGDGCGGFFLIGSKIFIDVGQLLIKFVLVFVYGFFVDKY